MEEILIASNGYEYARPGYTQVDVRALPDPHALWEEESDGVKPADGRDPRVEEWLKHKYGAEKWRNFLENACKLVKNERKVVFLCVSGRYRSVAVANAVGRMLKAPVLHYGLEDDTKRPKYVLADDGTIIEREESPAVVLGSLGGGSLKQRREAAKAAKRAMGEGATGEGTGSMFIF